MKLNGSQLMKRSNKAVKVVASPVFKLSLHRFRAFLSSRFGKHLADTTVAGIKKKLIDELPANPLIAPVSERLLELGLTEYRQWQIDEHNLIVYRLSEVKNEAKSDSANNTEKEVQLLLIMDSRQSLQKLLFELNLLL